MNYCVYKMCYYSTMLFYTFVIISLLLLVKDFKINKLLTSIHYILHCF